MIDFDRFVLPNGMKVLVHRDTSSPLATFNIMYNVGSRDENPQKTGFAHLFEHLMFEGTQNVPDFDGALYLAGGESNAYTNADTTDYYLTLPSANLETAFWLESDRMQSLSLTESVFNTARQVVIEEFNQRYLNQPYGDIWLQLRPLAYRIHPYRWPTIGASIDHLLHAELDDVQEFYRRFYVPNNAVMAVCGDVTTDQVYRWSEKWFAPIPARKVMRAGRHPEPEQMEYRRLDIDRDVPSDAIYKVYHTGGRLSADFRAADFLSDVLDAGKSSRLYQHLVQEKRLFSDIQAYVTGEEDRDCWLSAAN